MIVMASKQTRIVALLLVASLFMNTIVLPVQATGTEESAAITETPTKAPAETLAEEVDSPADETEGTETTEAAEETIVTVDAGVLLAAQESGYRRAMDYYLALPISDDRTMPLEWWYAMTGRASMRELDNAVLEDPKLAEQFLKDAETSEDWSAFLSAPESISVGSGSDLILLSYVSPREYQDQTIVLTDIEESKLLLSQPIDVDGQTLSYLGLGGLDTPFEGIIRFDENTEETAFVLNSHLFIGLSNKAQFLNCNDQVNPITLISEATAAFDGLLAQHILGERGDTACWEVILGVPTPSDSAAYYLPSVLGVLYGNTNVNLTLTDNSNLKPSDNGYLCAVMYPDACLDAKNITREISVPLVGELSEKATLVTDAPQPAEESEAEEEPSFFIPIDEEGKLKFYADMPEEAFRKIVDYYAALPVVSGEMPLEWWFAVCGREDELYTCLTGQLEAELEKQGAPAAALFAAGESAEEEGSTETPVLLSENTIQINNAWDFATFAKVNINLTNDCVWNLAVQGSDNATFNLVGDIQNPNPNETPKSTTFDGIGTDETPFQGTLQVSGGGIAEFKLDRALFHNISTSARIAENTTLKLLTALTTGNTAGKNLFADDVVPAETETTVDWSLIVGKDSNDNNTVYIPSLIGTIQDGADVTLRVTVDEGLTAAGKAFLCTQMEGASVLNYSCGSLPEFRPYGSPAGTLVGKMSGTSQVNFTATGEVTISIPFSDSSAAYVGGLVGEMGAGTRLVVNPQNNDAIIIDVNNQSGRAGGLVGQLNEAALEVNTPIKIKHVSAYTNAGGLISEATNPNFAFGTGVTISGIDNNPIVEKIGGNGNGNSNAGGIAGQLTLSKNLTLTSSTSDTSKATVVPIQNLTISNGDCGGLFGKVVQQGALLKIDYSGLLISGVTLLGRASRNSGAVGGLIGWLNAQNAKTSQLEVTNTTKVAIEKFGDTWYAGGLVGAADYEQSLKLSGTVTISASDGVKYLGGVLGSINQGPVYAEFSDIIVTTSDPEDNNSTTASKGPNIFGGLIGYSSDHGHLIHVDGVNLSDIVIAGQETAGGLVGEMNGGALYMAQKPTMDQTLMKIYSDKTDNRYRGWIVGKRGNALVCSATEWPATIKDDYDINDTGRWGRVLDLMEIPGLVTVEDVTGRAGKKLTVSKCAESGGSYSVGTITDFAAVALRVQLQNKNSTWFSIPSDIGNNGTVNITLDCNISLKDTGLTGLTRDHNSGDDLSFDINGSGNKITLDETKIFVADDAHDRQGLINKAKTVTLKDLVVDGNPQIKVIRTNDAPMCGLVNVLNGDGTLTDVTSSVEWDILTGSANSPHMSGMICQANGNGSTISFTGCTWNGSNSNSVVNTNRFSAGFLAYTGRTHKENNVDVSNSYAISVSNCNVNGTISHKGDNNFARVGGLIGSLLGDESTLNITNLTVNGATVTNSNDNTARSGGLLGYEWLCGSVVFDGVTISNSKLTAGSKAKFGGMVYRGSGYWKVLKQTTTADENSTSTTSGGFSISKSSFTGNSDNDQPSGLFVCLGSKWWVSNTNPDYKKDKALYLEIGDKTTAYKLTGVTVTVPENCNFDELVGVSMSGDGNGIVSIGTGGGDPFDQSGCTTYTKQLATDYNNPHTRYYYNLDAFRNDPNGDIDTAGEMVLLSAGNHCSDDLRQYFITSGKITDTIDLSGCSYYPIAFQNGISIDGATIKFDYEQIETAEKNNKQPSNANRQHAQMHTGIFSGAVNSQAEGALKLSVKDLTLKGNVGPYNVGPYNGQSGAIIRGDVHGTNNSAKMELSFENITLDGIYIHGHTSGVQPLLVNSIGSFATLNMNGVRRGAYTTVTSNIASSLIGAVGGDNAQHINLTFSNMKLNETNTDKCGLFSRAMFLESFVYSDQTSSGVYNFERSDDYTLGFELSNTNSGRNQKLQYWFFKENQSEGNEISTQLSLGTPASAFTDYPRYVGAPESGNNHELDINLLPADLLEGCGTYSHPYIIRNAAQLQALAKLLMGAPRSNWKVKVDNAVLEAVDFSSQDVHTAQNKDTSGEEIRLADQETIFTYGGNGWEVVVGNATQKDNLLLYLRSAYYQIEENLDLGDGWVGLGDSAPEHRFRGVIVGKSTDTTVTLGKISSQQVGGLVKYSDGCVVKNLTIEFTNTITVNAGSSSTVLASPSFFGGVVGWCIGGDTIIDNVTVQAAAGESVTISANGAVGWSPVVGGVVGLVGGTSGIGGGGVVFRTSINSQLTIPTGSYCNACVGRVMDGYAVSETPTIACENYQIPVLGEDTDFGLAVSSGTVTVSNKNGLWALSALVNARSRATGKSRTVMYDNVGTTTVDLTDEGADAKDYISKRCNLSDAIPNSMTLSFTADCDMRSFGNGFRGIGVSHGKIGDNGYSSDVYPIITSLDAGNHTITLAQSVTEPAGQSPLWSRMGAGLFPVMRSGAVIRNLKLAGTITFDNGYTATSYTKQFEDFGSAVGVGMLAGRVLAGGNLTCSKVEVGGTVTAETVTCVGGLIGYSGNKDPNNDNTLTFTDCKYSGLIVKGLANVGGLAGYACAGSISITGFDGSNGDFSSKGSSKLSLPVKDSYGVEGVGGLVGISLYADFTASDITLDGLKIETGNTTKDNNELGLGGLVGILLGDRNTQSTGETVHVNINNVRVVGNVTITATSSSNDSLGGVIGFLSDPDFGGWTGTYELITELTDIHIADRTGNQFTMKGKNSGALIGQFKAKKADSDKPAERYISRLDMTRIFIGNDTAGSVKITGSNHAGGLLGQHISRPTITVDGVTIKNTITTSTDNSAGLVVASHTQTAGIVDIRNVSIDTCEVSGKSHQGFVYGNMDTNEVNGYNILIHNSKLTGSADSTGIFGGSNSNATGVQFVAVNAIECTIPEGKQLKDFGSITTNKTAASYAIRANFTMAENSANGTKPYMPVSPASGIGKLTIDGTSTRITGDGAAFKGNTTDAVVKAIIADTHKTYFNVSTQREYFASGDPAKMISNYLASSDSDLPTNGSRADFPVLVIPADTEDKVTEPIVNYLSLLTNQNKKYDWWKEKVTIKTFKWVNNAYQQQEDATLEKTPTGFQVRTGEYDNQKDQFTLLDVSFADPTREGERFHLYVPIIVQKLMEFKFWASVYKGTNYNANSYKVFDSLAIGSHGEQFTALIGYQLLYTNDQWQALVDNHENLLWNFQRIIRLNSVSGGLPANTKLTLVDRNDGNRAYFAKTNVALSGDVNLEELFGWTPRYICDLLTMEAEKNPSGKYVQTNESDKNSTLRIGSQYYRPATTEDKPDELWRISVNDGTKEESFFLTIQTESGSDLSNFFIISANKLPYSNQVKGMPTKIVSHKENESKYYAKNNGENHLIIGDFLQQAFDVVSVTREGNMSSSTTKQLQTTLRMTITKNNQEGYSAVFGDFTRDKKLYPQFDLFFKNEADQIVPIPKGTILDVTYKIGDTAIVAPSRNLDEASLVRLSGFPEGIPATEIGIDGLVIQAEVTLTYDEEGIRQQFPARTTQEEGVKEGVKVNGYSYLSYSSEILSGAPSQKAGDVFYYRQVVDVATLTYTTAIPDRAQEPVGQLGINGREDDSFGIDSVAYYSVATLNEAAQADSMRCELQFYPKNSDSKYSTEAVTVPYSAGFQIELDGQTLNGDQNGTISFGEGNHIDPDLPVTIHIPLTIKTGAQFEGGTYSNYKVQLKVSLWKGDKKIEGSAATDYIIYTNAKILTNLVRE